MGRLMRDGFLSLHEMDGRKVRGSKAVQFSVDGLKLDVIPAKVEWAAPQWWRRPFVKEGRIRIVRLTNVMSAIPVYEWTVDLWLLREDSFEFSTARTDA